MSLYYRFNDLRSRWRRVSDRFAKRLDATRLGFENKLRSSEEVTSLLLSQNDWYRHDRGHGRIASFVSCICLLALNALAAFGDSPFSYHSATAVSPPPKSKPAQRRIGIVRARVERPPGSLLLEIIDFFFSKKTVLLTFQPLIADWREEFFEALDANRYCKARWVSLRYYWAFAKACFLSKLAEFFKIFRGK
jgi:hypothetical protein